MKIAKSDRDEALASLRAALPPGTIVYTILRHVSRSGALRVIDLFVIEKGEPRSIAWRAARAIGEGYDNKLNGIRISGGGMDMGFELVYQLGRELYPQGFAVKGVGRNGDRSGHDSDGGYALKHRWM